MAITAGLTGTSQVPTGTLSEALPSDVSKLGLTSFCVRNRSTAAGDANVQIEQLHGKETTSYATIPPGSEAVFRVNNGGFTSMKISGVTAIVDWFACAKT